MNRFCIPLSFPVPLLKKDLDRSKYMVRHRLLDPDDVSDEYRAWLDSMDLMLLHSVVFYSLPDTPYIVHQDHFKRTDFPKINFVFEGKGSKMNWYTIKPEMVGKIPEPDVINPYMTFKNEEVDLLYSQEMVGTYLVQAGVPHNVTNITEPRWCISTVHSFKDKRLLKWEQAGEIFKQFMI